MKTRVFFSICFALICGSVMAQTAATIEKVEVSGIPEQTLSSGLRDAMQKLAGQPFDSQTAEDLAQRIQNEQTDSIAAVKTVPGTQPSRVRLVFVVARKSNEPEGPDSNVNSQYTVESVEVKGIKRNLYSDALYDDMQKMIGQMLNNKLVEELRKKLAAEPMLKNQYTVSQRIERGSQPQHIRVIFEGEKLPWIFRATLGKVIKVNGGSFNISVGNSTPTDKDIVESVNVNGFNAGALSDGLRNELNAMVGKRFDSLEVNHLRDRLQTELKGDYSVKTNSMKGSKDGTARVNYDVARQPWLPYRNDTSVFAYHPKQGISAFCCGSQFIKALFLTLGTDGDTLIERYKGYDTGLEWVSLGTRHLGASIEVSTYGVIWKQQTLDLLAAQPNLAGAYRTRQAVVPSMAFAFNRNFYVTGGMNFTQLRLYEPTLHWESAHEAIGSVHFDSKNIQHGKTSMQYTAAYDVRTGTRALGSDFVYTRHEWDGMYSIKSGRHKGKATLSAGRITGNPPLFERFSLGNTTALRGWNKFDLDPIGGTRLAHVSTEYWYRVLGVFMNSGMIWDDGQPAVVRYSLGVSLGPFSLAKPISCSQSCGPTFLIRF